MKVNLLETHDRLLSFTTQRNEISECCQDLINKRPFGDHPFYIFAHSRTIGLDEKFKLYLSGRYPTIDKVPDKTIIWQPRLTKPKAQENSMLFKAYPGSDNIKVIWMLPARELWEQFQINKMTANETIILSIDNYLNHRAELEAKEPDDLPDAVIDRIYREISADARRASSAASAKPLEQVDSPLEDKLSSSSQS